MCPFKLDKPTCAKCLVHCYRQEQRDQIRMVMRFAGTKMMLKHPLTTIKHCLDGFKKPVGFLKRTSSPS